MDFFGIWRCNDCDDRLWSFVNPMVCHHCGGTMVKAGMLNRYNPTGQEIIDFEKGLEAFRDGE